MKKVYGTEQVEEIAKKVLVYMNEHGSHILALSGDLGAGKTTLVQELAKVFGVTSPIQSPTFTILRSYNIEHSHYTHFVHIDAYRIADEEELAPIHFSDYLSTKCFVCIEWPEQISHTLKYVPHVVARIEHMQNNREIELYEKK
jgi:tRNA threonylcarbamoyladenosine biosynthesis protein TsaE